MKRDLKALITACALSLTVFSSAAAQDSWTQLVATAGLTGAQAHGLSLQEVAVLKFNRSSGRDDHIALVERGGPIAVDPIAHAQLIAASGLRPADAEQLTTTQVFAYKIDRDNADDLHLAFSGPPLRVDPAEHAQLIAALRLSPEEADNMPLSSLVIIKSTRQINDW